MAIVDERGRMFGRWNILDLAVLVLVLGLIPLGYAAFVLFRDRPPRLVKIEPAQLRQTETFTVKVTGENFRPYMRLSIGTQQGREFLFKSTEEAEVAFVSVPPGTYDVVLYDQAQERFRLPQAITISPSNLPGTQIVAIGALGNLDAARAAKLTPGTRLANAGEIVAVGQPMPDFTEVFAGARMVGVPLPNAVRLPAIIKFNCYVVSASGSPYCQVNGVAVAQKNLLNLETPSGLAAFQVQRVRSPAPLQTVTVTLRVVGHPSVLSKIKPGDIDTGGVDNDVEVLARVVNVGPVRSLGPGASDIEVTLQANVQRVNDTWSYDSMLLRAGSAMPLRTSAYEVTGAVNDITAPQQQ
jgi:hypothetical protein